jgi:hypothetical protein
MKLAVLVKQDVKHREVRKEFVQKESKQMREIHTKKELERLAHMGDRLLIIQVDTFIMDNFPVHEKGSGMSDHIYSQFCVTKVTQAAFFDKMEMEKPAPNNAPFSDHTKGNKVEALLAYLHAKGSSSKVARRQYFAIIQWFLEVLKAKVDTLVSAAENS